MQILEQLASGYNDNITSESIMLECASIQGYIKCMNEVVETSDILMEGAGFDKFKEFVKKIFGKIRELLNRVISFFTKRRGDDSKSNNANKTTKTSSNPTPDENISDDKDYIIRSNPYDGIDLTKIEAGYDAVADKLKSFDQFLDEIHDTIMNLDIKCDQYNQQQVENLISKLNFNVDDSLFINVFENKVPFIKNHTFKDYDDYTDFFVRAIRTTTGEINQVNIYAYNIPISSQLRTLNDTSERLKKRCDECENSKYLNEIKSILTNTLNMITKITSEIMKFNSFVMQSLKSSLDYVIRIKTLLRREGYNEFA